MEKKNYQKEFIEKRKKQRICVLCGKPLDRDGIHCKACRKKLNEEQRLTRKFYQDHGICPRCLKNNLFGDEKQCPECAARSYESTMRTRDKEHYNETHKKWAKIEYQRRKKQGICTRCGKRKPLPGYFTCGICQEKDRARKRIASQGSDRNKRYEKGLCYFCDNPIKEGYKVCEYHYQLNCANANSERAKQARKNLIDKGILY